MRTADPEAKTGDSGGGSKRTAAELFLRSVLGTVFAVAVAALALWPHVRPLID